MNRSYSKIRHIQESNMILEKRLLSEEQPTQTNPAVDCQKKTGISATDLSIANYLVKTFDLSWEPIEGYGNLPDEEIVAQITKIGSKQSYDKINQYLHCFINSTPTANKNGAWEPNDDIIKKLLGEFLSGLSGTFDMPLRVLVNTHFEKIGVPVSIGAF